MFKKWLKRKIQNGVKAYFKAHPQVKLICVVGSVGKTSTKNAIATLLDEKYKIGGAKGNHNTELSAPLGILGIKYPENVKNPLAWLKVLIAIKARVRNPETVDVIVQELGTESPGELAEFGSYLKPDITVLTTISAEHMVNFKTLEAVAEEEMTAINFAKEGIINKDDVDDDFSQYLTNSNVVTYGSSDQTEYSLIPEYFSLESGFITHFKTPTDPKKYQNLQIKLIGEHSLRAVTAAIVVADKLDLTESEIRQGLANIRPYAGRMNLLNGIKNSTIIDDSYNASPLAVISAIETLQKIDAVQRIVVLGSMNELDDLSESAHQQVAVACKPAKIDWVITVGDEANKFLAPAAQKIGLQVKSFKIAPEAGMFLKQILKQNGLVLFKGSQGNVYLEEAIKIILRSASDDKLLVRQSLQWLRIKQEFFKKIKDENEKL